MREALTVRGILLNNLCFFCPFFGLFIFFLSCLNVYFSESLCGKKTFPSAYQELCLVHDTGGTKWDCWTKEYRTKANSRIISVCYVVLSMYAQLVIL